MKNPLLALLLLPALTLAPATSAAADGSPSKDSLLAEWTQPTESSFNAWREALSHRADFQKYDFNWSTDFCTGAPEKPMGFNFTLACRRHDFGYRNYSGAGRFKAQKARLDNTFRADLTRECSRHSVLRPFCLTLAWTYYTAAKNYGDDPASSRRPASS